MPHRSRTLLGGLLTTAILATGATQAVAADELVAVPDESLRACLTQALGGRPLTADNLASVTPALTCKDRSPAIRDLTGVEHLTALRGLNIAGNAVSDLTPVNGLPALVYLTISDNEVSDLSPLTDLPALLSITLGQNPLTTLAPLAVLPALTTVDVHDLESADLTTLTAVTTLRSLTLGGRPAADYAFLADLTWLGSLRFMDSRLTGLDDIPLPSSLTNLTLYTPNLGSLAGVESLSALDSILASSTKVADLAAVRGLSRLRVLSLGASNVADLSPLSGLIGLEELRLPAARLADLRPLAGLTRLRKLELRNNAITDVRALSPLKSLTDTLLDDNQIMDFSPLRDVSASVSGRLQRVSLPALRGDEPTSVSFRGPDGAYLRLVGGSDSGCQYTSGALTCSNEGSYLLTYQSGSASHPGPVTVQAWVEVTRLPFAHVGTAVLPRRVPVGKPVTVAVTGWSPAPDRLTYQWLSNDGSPIPGATSARYTSTGAEGPSVGVEVTAHRRAYRATTSAAVWTTLDAVPLVRTPKPTIRYTGRLATDTVLTAKPWTWDKGVELSYQWQNDGVDIPGATHSTYTVKASDVGDRLRVHVTGRKPGYFLSTRFSASVQPTKASFASKAPVVRGTRAVGKKLSAETTWPAGARLTYQWYRNGKVIKGATKASYTLKASDRGDRFKVRVKARKAGYVTRTMTSATTAKAVKGTLTPGRLGILSGTSSPGTVLTAYHGTWKPGGVSFSYRWYRDAKAIPGASAKSYRLTTADTGHVVTVRITGTKYGYSSLSKLSSGVVVA